MFEYNESEVLISNNSFANLDVGIYELDNNGGVIETLQSYSFIINMDGFDEKDLPKGAAIIK